MIGIRNLFKSNLFILLFALVLDLTIFGLSFVFLGKVEFGAEVFIIPIICLLFGPYAALGCAISQIIIGVIFDLNNIFYHLCTFFIVLLAGILVWKLWYASLDRFGLEIPNLGNYSSFIKMFVSYFGFYAVIAFSFALPYDYRWIFDFEASLSISLLLLLFSIYFVNYVKIPVYVPRKQLKSILPEKVYSIIFLLIMFGALVFAVYADYFVILFMLALVVIYLSRPYNPQVFKLERTININLVQKMTFSVLLIAIFLECLFLIAHILGDYNDILATVDNFGLYYLIHLFSRNATIFILLFLIPFLFYLYYLEKNVTNPINSISTSLNVDLISKNSNLMLKENLKSISNDNEIKKLTNSLIQMESDVDKYRNELLKVTAENERYETELYLAESIQSSLIPTDFDKFCENKNFDIYGIVHSSRETRGDFYDYFQIDDENIGFVIGDVDNKGIHAALIVVEVMTLIQDYAKHYDDLSKCFVEVNDLLCNTDVKNSFVTSIIGKLNLNTGDLFLVNAGHNYPLFKYNGQEFEYLNVNKGLALAIQKNVDYEILQMKMSPGDTLFLYTNGVTDAESDSEGIYGEDRLRNILNEHSSDDLESIISSLEKDIDVFCDYQEQVDDRAMFVLKFK